MPQIIWLAMQKAMRYPAHGLADPNGRLIRASRRSRQKG
jgi:hypothetical protein